MLHELLVGRHLFVVDNERETLRRLTDAVVAPPSQANARVTPALDEVVLRALSRDPDERFANAHELADALERVTTPGRATRRRVTEVVLPLVSGAPVALDDVHAAPAAALPMEPAWTGTTGTIHARRRAARVASAAPRRRARIGGGVRALAAMGLVAAALLAPLPREVAQPREAARRWLATAIENVVALADAPAPSSSPE